MSSMEGTATGASDGLVEATSTVRKYSQSVALAVLLAWQLMVVLDGTIVNIALTHIRDSLGFSQTSLSWVVNAYALTFGGLLMLGGRAGDILGRRRVLVFGVLFFTAASALGGFATSAEWLIAARVLQGIGAAIAAPSTLSLIVTNFEGPDRTRALSIFSSVSGVGASVGLILGGVLTSWLSWHWVFFVNIPIGLVVAFLAPRTIKESESIPGRLDIGGAIASTAGVTSLVYGFIRAAESGWTDTWTIGAFLAAVVLLVGFVMIELRVEQPIMPLRLFAQRDRAVAFLNMLLVPSAMFGVFFFLTQYLQNVLGMSALESGFAFLPLSASIVGGSRLVPRVAARIGTRMVMIGGTVLLIAGLALLSRLHEDSAYWPHVVIAIVLIGFGAVSNFVSLSLTIMGRIDSADSGAASGLLQTVQQVGGAIGLAILVTVFGTVDSNALADGKEPLEAMTQGMQTGFLTAAGIAVVVLIVAIFGFRRTREQEEVVAPSVNVLH